MGGKRLADFALATPTLYLRICLDLLRSSVLVAVLLVACVFMNNYLHALSTA